MYINYDKLKEAGVPDAMIGGVKRYIERGTRPGHFLSAVIVNDLYEAVGRADESNSKALSAWVKFFYNDAPGSCWGSENALNHWVQGGGLKGMPMAANKMKYNMGFHDG